MSDKVYILVGYQTYQHKDYVLLKNKFNELINNEKYYYLKQNKIPYYFEDSLEKIGELKDQYYYTIQFDIDLLKYLDYENQIEKIMKKKEL